MLGGGGETAQEYASRSRPPEGWGALSISAPFCYTLTLHTDKAAALIPRVALEEPFSEALLPGSTILGNPQRTARILIPRQSLKVLGRLLSTIVLPESVFVEILSLLFLPSLHPRRLGSAVTISPFHIWAEQIQRDG
jgi:hypothetical protein